MFQKGSTKISFEIESLRKISIHWSCDQKKKRNNSREEHLRWGQFAYSSKNNCLCYFLKESRHFRRSNQVAKGGWEIEKQREKGRDASLNKYCKIQIHKNITRARKKRAEKAQFPRNGNIEARRARPNCENEKTRRRINKRARLEAGTVTVQQKKKQIPRWFRAVKHGAS